MSDGWESCLGAVLWLFLIFVILGVGAYVGYDFGEKAVRIEAVQHGAASWIVAPDGSTTFEWNEDKRDE